MKPYVDDGVRSMLKPALVTSRSAWSAMTPCVAAGDPASIPLTVRLAESKVPRKPSQSLAWCMAAGVPLSLLSVPDDSWRPTPGALEVAVHALEGEVLDVVAQLSVKPPGVGVGPVGRRRRESPGRRRRLPGPVRRCGRVARDDVAVRLSCSRSSDSAPGCQARPWAATRTRDSRTSCRSCRQELELERRGRWPDGPCLR